MSRQPHNTVITGRLRQRAFSLVELMIAILLGSLITIATVQLFATSQRTFQLQQGLIDVQEQGRFALDFMARDLRMMGLRLNASDVVGIELADVVVSGAVTFPATADGGDAGAGNDRLTFSFRGRTIDTDCEGVSPPVDGTLVVNTYWVDGDGLLWCRGNLDPAGGGLELVSGVDTFQVLYGIDTEEDGVPFAARYVSASNLTADDQVVAVRIGLLVRSQQGNVAPLGDVPTMVVLDRQLTGGQAPLDEPALRRLFVTTVRARNYVWEKI